MTDPFAPPGGAPPPSTWPSPQGQPASPWQQGPWQQGDWQPHPEANRPTNGLAIAALVTGLVALVPVSVGLALVALRQIRRRGERGTGLAVGGIAASAVWLVIVALVGVLALTGVFDYSREGDLGDVATEAVGSCLNEDPPAVTDCGVPHDLEVFYSAAIPDPAWPGEHEVDDIADDICQEAFDDYVGVSYDDSEYDYTFFAPSESEWQAGRHTVVCVVTPASEYLVGSVRGSGD